VWSDEDVNAEAGVDCVEEETGALADAESERWRAGTVLPPVVVFVKVWVGRW